MAYGDIPQAVLSKLASERMRMYHAMWHYVRSESAWNELSPDQQKNLENQNWKAPRFEHTSGAGIDFLYMHQRMIEMVNLWGAENTSGEHHHDAAWTQESSATLLM